MGDPRERLCDRCQAPLGEEQMLCGSLWRGSVVHEDEAICDQWDRARSLAEKATQTRKGEATDLQDRLDRALDHIETIYSLASQGRKPPGEVDGDPSPYLKDLREFMATQGRSLT